MYDAIPGALYKRIDADTFVRYDPARDAYDVVPADRVPPVEVAAARVRLSAAERRDQTSADPHGDFRKATLLAMLDFQERAHAAGDPESARPYLDALAQLAGDPDGARALRMSWIRQQAGGRYGFKAVGVGEHAGRVEYGQDAERALRAQDAANPPEAAGQTFPAHREAKGWVAQGTKAVGYGDYAGKKIYGKAATQRLQNQQSRDDRMKSGARARDLLYKLHANAGQGVSPEELNELATHLPNLPVERLRRARLLLDASWGGEKLRKAGMIDKLQSHIRGMVDAQMQAAGAEPVNPAPAEEPPAPPAAEPQKAFTYSGKPAPPSAEEVRRRRDAEARAIADERPKAPPATPAPAQQATKTAQPTKPVWEMTADESRAAGTKFFRTQGGSLYAMDAQGRTTRVKADHTARGHDAKDVGLKKTSDKTVYVASNVASALSSAGVTGPDGKPPKQRLVLHDGKATLITFNSGTGQWGATASGRNVPVSDKPAKGMSPLELWGKKDDVQGAPEAYSGTHAGSAITEDVDHDTGHAEISAAAGKPAPATPAPQQPATQQPAAPESSDYSKFDAIHRTTGDRAKAEQIARVTGVPVRPEEPAAADSDLAPHGIGEDSSRDDVIAAASRIAPELGEKVRKLPKAKQLAAIREHLKNAPKPAEPAPQPTSTSAAPHETAFRNAFLTAFPDAKQGGTAGSLKTTVAGRDVEARYDPDMGAAVIDFFNAGVPQGADEALAIPDSVRGGSVSMLRQIGSVVDKLGESGVPIAYSTDERRHQLYQRAMTRAGYALASSEPDPDDSANTVYRWEKAPAPAPTGTSAAPEPAPAEQQPEAPKADAVQPAPEKPAPAKRQKKTPAPKPEPAADLPDAPPGKLFDAGDEVPRAEGVRTLESIADAARRRIPDLDMEPAKAGAPLEDHLDALTAIDRHMRKKGFPTSYFGDAADAIEELKKGIAEGKYDQDDLEEMQEDAKYGRFVEQTNPAHLAQDMRGQGLFDEARFFERHALKVNDIAREMIAGALAKLPKDEEPERKPAARTLEELEDRVREEFGKPGVDAADAYFEAMADVPPAVKRQFFDKHNIKTGDGNGAAYYKTVGQVRDKFAPDAQPAPKPESAGGEPQRVSDLREGDVVEHNGAPHRVERRADRPNATFLKPVGKGDTVTIPHGKNEPRYRPGQNLDNDNTNDKVTSERPAEPRAQGGANDVVLEETGRGTGEGRDRAGERVGAPVRGERAGGAAGTGEGDGERVPVLRPGAGGGSDQALQPTDGQRDGPGDGAGTGDARPVRPRLKRKSGGPPRDPETGTRLGGGADGTEPALPNPTPAEAVVSEPPAAENPTDVSAGNFRYTDREFFKGGQKAKYNANLAAIRVLKQIQEEGRDTATPEEQAILSKYTGWGQFPALFNDYYDKEFREEMEKRGVNFGEFDTERRKWDAEREVLQGLMTPEEWKAAGRSTLNAHYTHPDVVDAHWKIAQQLGFKGGRYLETSAGAGYYLGLMPPELAARTRSSAVEKDAITAGILKLLYPASNVQHSGFEKHDPGDNFYDLVASNVPFGDYKVHDPRYNKHQANIHDYFFLKSMDKVRPGGLVMHITSTGTLDKMDPAIRKKLYEQGDLVGAIRFPGDAHKENAGTSVVTDMLIFRKRLPGEQPGDRSWLNTTTVPDPDGGEPIPVNNYFAKNPHMVLGTIDRKGKLYGGKQANVSATEDYADRLNKAVAALPSNVMSSNRAPKERFAPDTLAAPGDVKQGGFKVKDGKVFVRKGSELVQQEHDAKTAEKIGAHVEVLDAVRALLRKETAGEDATKERANLNAVYDAFVKKHGPLNLPANKKAFNAPDDAPVLHALENYDSKSKKATKTDIFTKPVVAPVPRVTKAGSVAEGLGVSLHETGGLDVKRIAELTGKDEKAVGRELLENGLAYEDPSHGWQPADQYLSGNVRQKLATARAAAAADPRYAPNVAALEKVQPADLHHDEISANLGAAWIPPSDIEEFSREMLNARPGALKVTRVPHTNEWHADWNDKYTATSAAAKQKWGVSDPNTGKLHADFADLLKSALSGSPMTIKTKLNPDGDPVVNRDLTEAANAKVQELRDEFKNWIWVDQERRERLHRHYNDNFNSIRPINYDGSHLKLPGMTPSFKLRPHQKNFVWQVVSTGKGLAAHEVGTGKTASMIAAAMELRRLGLAKKPCIAGLKANAEAIAAEARRLYPGARVVSIANIEGKDAKKRRQEAFARIATGDYDIVVMTHDQLNGLGMRKETRVKYMREELAELEAAHAAAVAEEANGRAGKELKKAKENLEAKLQEAMKAEEKDDAVNFEDLGIDQLFVDEAHAYKRLPAYSKRRGLKGINNERSNRATNMLMRTRWLMENNGGRGVVFATGTPITNTVGELYVMQKYLQPEELKSRGIMNFDSWASTFAEQETKQEKTTTGEYKNVTRLSKYNNVPELKAIAGQMLDNQRVDNLKDRFPFADEAAARAHAAKLYAKNPYTEGKTDPTDEDLKAVGMEVTKTDNGYEVSSPIVARPRRKDILHELPPIQMTRRMMEELQARAKAIKGKKASEGGDNMLTICTDGRKGAIDARMLFADAPDDPDSKANKLVEQVLRISKEHPGKTQMIFSDMGVNPGKDKGVKLEFADSEGEDGADEAATETTLDSGSRTGFHLYGDIIDKLVEGGIPRDKIADFSKLSGDAKEEAIAKLKTGEMLVAIGGTQKLGTGVNAQDKLVAMHHLDVPQRPADLEQRDGRGWRNGNENKEVQVHKYVTQKSLDDMFWGTISRKDKMIKQMLSKNPGTMRDMIEEDTEELSADQIMAAASGDPRILEKVQVEDDIRKLQNAAKRHDREQYEYQRSLRVADSKKAEIQRTIDGFDQAAKHLEARPDFEFKLRDGQTFTSRKEGGEEAANEALGKVFGNLGFGMTVGEYRGLRLLKDSGNLYLLLPNNSRVHVQPTLKSIEATARRFADYRDSEQSRMEQHEKDTATLRANAGKKFPKADELQKKIERQKELEKALKEEQEKEDAPTAG